MQRIKLVTFDATNTLLKFKIPPWKYYSIVAREYGFTGTDEILKSQMKESFKKMELKHPNFGRSDVTWENWWKEVVKLTFQGQLPKCANIDTIAHKLINEFKTTNCWSVVDGSQKLLNILKQNEVCVGIISNFDPRLTDILRNISLYNNFDFIVTSYEVGYSKPDKRIFSSAIKACNKSLKPSECLHVGDDLVRDYEGARAAGWHALLVASTITRDANLALAEKHIFKSIEELCEALDQNKIQL